VEMEGVGEGEGEEEVQASIWFEFGSVGQLSHASPTPSPSVSN